MAFGKKKTAKKPAPDKANVKASDSGAGKAAAKEPARKSGGDLVSMTRNGETIKVSPKCVADHERLGWSRD